MKSKLLKFSFLFFISVLLVTGCSFGSSDFGSPASTDNPPAEQGNSNPDNSGNGSNDSTIYVPEKASIPDTPFPNIILDTSSYIKEGEDGYEEGEQFININANNEQLILTVTPCSDGLHIVKNHPDIWKYINIRVHELTENNEIINVSIDTNNEKNEFVYPFVKAGSKYKVFITKAEENWANWESFEKYAVWGFAIGGLGNFRITHSDYEYHSPSDSVILNDLTITMPASLASQTSLNDLIIKGNIYDDGEWHGNSIWSDGFKLVKSALDLSRVSTFLLQKQKIFVDLSYAFNYEEQDYNEEFLRNQGHYFVNTNTFYNPGDTGLANIYLTTEEGRSIDRDTWINGGVKITTHDGTILLEDNAAQLKGRGNSSWGTGKNPYTFKLDKKKSILGMKEHKRWVLMANFYDRSMVRTRFAAYLGNEIYNSTWNASFVPVNLFVNGIYCGTYDVGEQIKIDENRVNIQSIDKKKIADVNGDGTADINDGGFITEIDFRNGEERHFYSDEYHLPFNLRDPDELTDAQFEYAKAKINDVESMLTSENFAAEYAKYIDVNSMIDWWIMNEFSRNNDAIFQTSVYMYYNPVDGKMYMGPNWDFDLAFGNYWDKDKYKDFYIYGGKKYKGTDDPDPDIANHPTYEAFWLNRLFEIPEFKAAAKARWQQKSSALYNAINSQIQSMADEIDQTIPCNEYLLPRLGQYSWNGPDDYESRTTYKAEVDYLIDWCQKRYNWMNSEISRW